MELKVQLQIESTLGYLCFQEINYRTERDITFDFEFCNTLWIKIVCHCQLQSENIQNGFELIIVSRQQ